MITAVDTCILLDVFGSDPGFGPGSKAALRDCIAAGILVACDAVWAETSASFPSAEEAATALDDLGVHLSDLDRPAVLLAGSAWRAYRRRGGKRERVIADFLIGAHASTRAERLLTRDRGFFRTYFRGLDILDPTA